MGFRHLASVGRIWRTVRHLKPVQVVNRIWRRVRPVRIGKTPGLGPLRNLVCRPAAFIYRHGAYLGESEFLFLNQRRRLTWPGGWNEAGVPRLWLYNLHYFDYLDLSAPSARDQELIDQWIKDNRPVMGVGWEPYPISLRVVNWIKWGIAGGQLAQSATTSIAIQLHALEQMLEYHLLGNHLWANGKALVFGGLYFTGEASDRWLQKGLDIIGVELQEQILGDGGHFERSPTYHAIVLEDLLDLISLFQAYGREVPVEWRSSARSMVEWLSVMTRPDGKPPLFNDAAYGISPALTAIRSYAERLGLDVAQSLPAGMYFLQDTGYFRYTSEHYTLFGDVGAIGPDYIPGHAHADTFSFELFANGLPIVVDVGTSTYEPGARRLYERGTSAHNTVQIGSIDQSEVWGSFRVGRRAKVIDLQTSSETVYAAHTGYRHIGAVHRRQFLFGPRTIRIIDQVERDACYLPAVARLHFAPDIRVILEDNVITAGPLRISIANAHHVSLFDYDYAPEFNHRIPATGVAISFDTHLECSFCL